MIILEHKTACKKIERMAIQLAESNLGTHELFLIGIKDHGVFIAHQLAEHLKKYFEGHIEILDLSMNKRDPDEISLSKTISLTGKNIVLIDDVSNSGKVFLYALAPLLKQKPAKVETVALVERQHKLFPININYVGISVSTSPNQYIQVDVDSEEMTAHLIG